MTELDLSNWPLMTDLLVDNAEGAISLRLSASHHVEQLALRCTCLSVSGDVASLQALERIRLVELRAVTLAAGTPEVLAAARLHFCSTASARSHFRIETGLVRRGHHAVAVSEFACLMPGK